jgi:hypothetical protein
MSSLYAIASHPSGIKITLETAAIERVRTIDKAAQGVRNHKAHKRWWFVGKTRPAVRTRDPDDEAPGPERRSGSLRSKPNMVRSSLARAGDIRLLEHRSQLPHFAEMVSSRAVS